jgi:hypothetical protein
MHPPSRAHAHTHTHIDEGPLNTHTHAHTHTRTQQPLGDRRAWGAALCGPARIRHGEAGCNRIPNNVAARALVQRVSRSPLGRVRAGPLGRTQPLSQRTPHSTATQQGRRQPVILQTWCAPVGWSQPRAAAARSRKSAGRRGFSAAGCTSSSALQRVRPVHRNSGAADQVRGRAGATGTRGSRAQAASRDGFHLQYRVKAYIEGVARRSHVVRVGCERPKGGWELRLDNE